MKIAPVLYLCILSMSAASAASLLTAQKFPNTFKDLSFTNRMAILAEGYEPWETEYDENGRCISNCAYAGITIDDEIDKSRKNTAAAVQTLQDMGYTLPNVTTGTPSSVVMVPTPPIDVAQPTQNFPPTIPQEPTLIVAPAPTPTTPQCTPHNPAIDANQTVPLGEPVLGRPKITSAYGVRTHPATGQRHSFHHGVDLAVPKGTTVFSPANGTVASVWTDKTCGNGLKIRHSDGYETVYCHLSATLAQAGDNVMAGCAVAKTGNTGRSTGPHLHYGIKYNGESVDPAKFMGR